MSEQSQRLLKVILDSELSYVELEKKTGIAKSSIQRYASGATKKIPIDAVKLIADATNSSAAWIMGWDDNHTEETCKTTEPTVLQKYNRLNFVGQCKVDAYIDGLLENTVYLKSDSSTENTYSTQVAAFGGASKTGEITKEALSQLVDELENIND